MIRFSVRTAFVALALTSFARPASATRVLEVSLADLVARAQIVADVDIVPDTASSFWVEGRIFTRQTARVRALWKGVLSVKAVSIVTRGGVVGRIGQRVDEEVVLEPGAHGVAFLRFVPELDGYRVVALRQGFVPPSEVLEARVRSYAH